MTKTHTQKSGRGQSTLEFAFSMIAMAVLMYGLILVFRWTGLDLAERRISHDNTLINVSKGVGPEEQLTPNFHRPREIGAVFSF